MCGSPSGRWHHANVASNANFAGEFPWIDALFGTLYLPKGMMPERYRIDEEQPVGYFQQMVWPFQAVTAGQVRPSASATTASAISSSERSFRR